MFAESMTAERAGSGRPIPMQTADAARLPAWAIWADRATNANDPDVANPMAQVADVGASKAIVRGSAQERLVAGRQWRRAPR
jgi:hypothetical protein